jgi:hypothetical protein
MVKYQLWIPDKDEDPLFVTSDCLPKRGDKYNIDYEDGESVCDYRVKSVNHYVFKKKGIIRTEPPVVVLRELLDEEFNE